MQISKPLVSILMLTYNRASFISEAIASVIAQTFTDWELVIIDDGSTDDTATIVAQFADPRIHYITHETNAGLFARRAESLRYATEKYTAILDSDDYWTDAHKLAKQVSFLDSNPEYVVIGTGTVIVNKEGTTIGTTTYAQTDALIRKTILARNQFTHSSVVFKTEALLKTIGYQPTLAEDLELILQLGQFEKFANLNDVYTAHRVHSGSQNDHGIKMARAVHHIITVHKDQYPGYLTALMVSYSRLLRAKIKSLFTLVR